MAVKLRLMRMGKKKQPTYRVVAADGRSPRDGRFIEIIGTYEPRQDPSVIKIDNDKAVKWLADGAQPTERVEKLLKISGAWETHTGEAAPAAITVAGDSKPSKKEQAKAEVAAEEAEEAAEAPAAEEAATDDAAEEAAPAAEAAGEEE